MKDILEKIESFVGVEETQIEEANDRYEEFFKEKLKEWGVKSPSELPKKDREKFFAEVSKE
ncbi:MAG: hypothetical protein ACOCT9_01975 [archaeon]